MKYLLLFFVMLTSLFGRSYPIKEVTRIVDGDTIDVVIDLGFGITLEERLRFFGIDAWETRGVERSKGLEAKLFVEKRIKRASSISIEVPEKERGKYGRILASVYLDGVCLNEELVKLGYAERASY